MAETNKTLRIVIVTPEKAVLDEPAEMVVLPMFDGERGVLPGHAPFVGQLGPGELRIRNGTVVRRYFIDAGFAQVTGSVVNVLTPRATAAGSLTAEAVHSARAIADALPVTTQAERDYRTRAINSAQGMAKVVIKNTTA